MKIENIKNQTVLLSCSREELHAIIAGVGKTTQVWSEEYAQKSGFEKKHFGKYLMT